MSAPILSEREMRELVRVDESAMPSTCFVYGGTLSSTATGGSASTPLVAKHDKPMRARVSLGGTAARERDFGGRIQSVVDLAIQISLTDLRKTGVEVDSDDEIEVTTVLVTPAGRKMTKVERYRVIGDPAYGSYATSLVVPVSRVT